MEKMLKPKDIRDYFGWGLERTYALFHSDSFPCMKIGKNYYITEDNFTEWLNTYKYKEFIL